MCGIAGCFLRTGSDAVVRARRMATCLAHRGPDGDGLAELRVSGWSAAVVHRRLAIIDLSTDAAQPMMDEESGIVLVFNGEIYNYRTVRDELVALGHSFRSKSDTEVILRGYLQWGRDAVLRLEGMFAIALWDPRDESLLLVRDRFGIKPLYYQVAADHFVFASEVRGLLASGVVPRELNDAMVAPFLHTGSVVSPDTLVRDVHSLAPGHFAEWRRGSLITRRYWSLAEAMESGAATPSREELQHTFVSTVRSEMVSDVPIGLFLSGGIDSSALVSALAGTGDLRTVALVFEEPEYDERTFSRAVATRFGTTHTEIPISAASIVDDLRLLPQRQDQPSVDGLNTFLVSRAAREAGLTVALSGLGGDELFGGYPTFQIARHWSLVRPVVALPRHVRAMVAHTLESAIAGRARKPLRMLAEVNAITDVYEIAREVHSRAAIARLLAVDSFVAPVPTDSVRDPVNQMTLLESGRYMLDTTLRQADSMSMAVSLEVRVPLLNHRLAELAMRVPPADRFRDGRPKSLLRDALPTALPSEIVNRRKGTFTLPYAVWLRTSFRPLVEELLFGVPTVARGLFDLDEVRLLWHAFLDGRPGVGWAHVWALCTLEGWCRENLDSGGV